MVVKIKKKNRKIKRKIIKMNIEDYG